MNILDIIRDEKVEWKKLGDIGTFFSGLNGKSKKDFINGNSKYVTYKNIFSNIEVDLNNLELVYIGKEKQNKLKKGDIIFTSSSENLKECGLSSVITKEVKSLYLNSFCFFYRFNEGIEIMPEFSKYLFRDIRIRKEIIKISNGVTRYNVSKSLMRNILIPIPKVNIQEKIVKIVDKLTKYINKLEENLKLELDYRKKQYEYYKEMLLSQDYLKSKGYEVKKLKIGDIGNIQMCKRILKNQTNEFGDIPFYKIGTFCKKADRYISRDLFNEYKLKYNYPKKGEVLISASATIGRTVIFDGSDSYFQDSNIVWISHKEEIVLNKYLFYLYQILNWNLTNTSTIDRLYNYNLKEIIIYIPSISVQENIINILDKFNKLFNDINKGLLKEIKLRKKQYEYYREKLLNFNKNLEEK